MFRGDDGKKRREKRHFHLEFIDPGRFAPVFRADVSTAICCSSHHLLVNGPVVVLSRTSLN
jgi:hypothetical protein